jgi:hypothetical protein
VEVIPWHLCWNIPSYEKIGGVQRAQSLSSYKHGEEPGSILICRIPHQSMLPENQAIDDEDDTPDLL